MGDFVVKIGIIFIKDIAKGSVMELEYELHVQIHPRF